jgi:hypothetical protein
MARVTVQQTAEPRERAACVTGPVIDLTDSGPRVVDEQFVVEWQISAPGPRSAEDERMVATRA